MDDSSAEKKPEKPECRCGTGFYCHRHLKYQLSKGKAAGAILDRQSCRVSPRGGGRVGKKGLQHWD